MSFSFLPWEIFKRFPDIISPNNPGIYGISCFDPFIEKMVVDKITQGKLKDNLHLFTGDEITPDWPDANLLGLDMFAGRKSFLILRADQMDKKSQTTIIEGDWNWQNRFFIAFFKTGSPFLTRLEKKQSGTFIKIKAPPFWEKGRMLKFLSEKMEVMLTPAVQNYLLASLPGSTDKFAHALSMIALNFPQTLKVSVDEVRAIIHSRHLDQFALADTFGDKKFPQFFETLIDKMERDLDFDGMRSFFAFMQGHLIKMADTDYTTKNARINQYDRKIINSSKKFNLAEIKKFLRLFGKWEILAKRKSSSLLDSMRGEFIKVQT